MTQSWHVGGWKLGLVSWLAISGAIASFWDCAFAQLVPDTTLRSENSRITPINPTVDHINGGATRGANLFHSFQEFNVGEGRSAYFTNPAGIENILTRVTGTNPSNILGTLGVTGGNANLFLINPQGIVFGANARLDIGGSLVASTASSLNFADGTTFSATAPQSTPLLTISVPIGLQFGSTPGTIQVQGNGRGRRRTANPNDTNAALRVQPNQTLALVGGDITLTGGTLKTAGGRLELGSVAGSSLVSLTPTLNGWTLGYEGVQNFQDIQLLRQATVDASGAGAGDIQVRGRNVLLQDGSQIEASTLGAEPGGTLSVTASESVEIIGRSANQRYPSGLFAKIAPIATGSGGNLLVNSNHLSISDGARVETSTFGQGDAGDLTVNAVEVELTGTAANGEDASGLFATVGYEATGNGGDLLFTSNHLSISGGARVQLSTFGQGDAGDLTVNAAEVELTGTAANGEDASGLFAGVAGEAIGNGGNVTIDSNHLSISDGAKVSATTYGEGNSGNAIISSNHLSISSGARVETSTFGQGDAGDLTVNAVEVELTGTAANGEDASGLFATVGYEATGNGGDLLFTSNHLSISGGARVQLSTFGQGDAGDLTVNAAEVELTGTAANGEDASGLFAGVAGEAIGNGGNVTIDSNHLSISDGAKVSATTYGEGNSGNAIISSNHLSISSGARVETSTFGQGDAGDLTVNAVEVELTGTAANGEDASGLFATVGYEATGNGGDLLFTSNHLSISGGARVQLSTFGQGDAGDLTVNAAEVELTGTAANGEDASGLFAGVAGEAIGNGGNVTIDSNHLSISDGAKVSATTYGEGNSGNAIISSNHLSISSGARVETSTFGQGDAGDLTVNAVEVELTGTAANGEDASGLFATVGYEATGNGGDLLFTSNHLSISGGARVQLSTFGQGDAGDLTVNAAEVELTGTAANGEDASGLFAGVAGEAIGNGGNVTIDSNHLSISDGAKVSATTYGEGNSGNAIISSNHLSISSGAKVSATTYGEGNSGNAIISSNHLSISSGARVETSTFGQGDAGNLTVNATDVELSSSRSDGVTSGLFARVEQTATGRGGNLTIKTQNLSVSNRAEIAVSSRGSGDAGDMEITADSIRLDNQGVLTAETRSGNGGNINIQAQSLLLLRNNSRISTTAGTAQAGGDGGNITINAPFIIAVPSENSDITANAYTGKGGRVEITAQGIFGIQFREEPTSESDITASSQLGVDGVVEINTPDIDPSRGLANLPAQPVDPEVVQGCSADGTQAQSEFILTGRGGLPPTPREALGIDAVEVDWVTLNFGGENRFRPAAYTNPTRSTPARLVEAQGWVTGTKGEVILVATAPTVTPHSSWLPPASCSVP